MRSFTLASSLLRRNLGVIPHRNLGISAVLFQQAQKISDPIQSLFLEKVREYAKKQKTAGGLFVEATPEIEKAYKEDLERTARVHAVKGDASKFPEFKFEEPKLDTINPEQLDEEKKK